MSKAFVFLSLISVVGGILFVQFMYEIWDKKEKERKNKGDFWY